MEKFSYGPHNYEYQVEKSDRKGFSLVIKPDLQIKVGVPEDVAQGEIERFLVRKWTWLERQLAELREYRKEEQMKQYVSGEAFQYLGRQYMLEVIGGVRDEVKLAPGKIVAHSTRPTREGKYNKILIDQWYRRRQRKVFRQQYENTLRIVKPDVVPKLEIKDMARRWGSFTGRNSININPRLIYSDTQSIRYVFFHELTHMNHRAHDKEFYRELERYEPDWKSIKRRLELKYGQYTI